MSVHVEDYEKVISMYRKTSLPAVMWRSQPPTAQPITQFKPVSAQLLWLDWQLRWPVKRQLGLLQYNWDIRPKPMSTHWGRVICVSKPSHYWTLDNGLAPIQFQAMIWSDIHWLINCTLGNKRCAISIKIQTFLFRKMHLKMSSANGIYFASASVYLIKSSEIVQNTRFCCRIIFKLGAKFGADTAILCATFQKDLTTD